MIDHKNERLGNTLAIDRFRISLNNIDLYPSKNRAGQHIITRVQNNNAPVDIPFDPTYSNAPNGQWSVTEAIGILVA